MPHTCLLPVTPLVYECERGIFMSQIAISRRMGRHEVVAVAREYGDDDRPVTLLIADYRGGSSW